MKAKQIIIAILCFTMTQIGAAQSSKALFDKYTDMDDVTSVYVSKAMFKMMPAFETAGLSLVNMAGKIESLQIISTERNDLAPKMREDFSRLIGKGHEELMRVRDGKTKATFYADMKGDLVKDLIMLADTDDGFTIIQLLGNFTLKDIQEITKEME